MNKIQRNGRPIGRKNGNIGTIDSHREKTLDVYVHIKNEPSMVCLSRDSIYVYNYCIQHSTHIR